MWGRFWCRLGFHKWVTAADPDGQRHLTCRRCGAFGDQPGTLTPGFGYRDTSHGP